MLENLVYYIRNFG